MWRILFLIALLGAWPAGPAFAQSEAPAPAAGDTTPVDYADPSHWLCRPDAADACAVNLDAMAVTAEGARTPAPYRAAAAPAVDCFYVYPTVSGDPTAFSDLAIGPEEAGVARAQVARLGATCRVFAPIYHQMTRAQLDWVLGKRDPALLDFGVPYRDVLAAWRAYLAHDNGGRGVVLIGHSQGAIILKRLIAEEIDGKPAQKLLVAAYLAGNIDLGAGSFRTIPPCANPGQAGCVVAWSSYPDETTGTRIFGQSKAGAALCVNPAAIGGGRGALKTYFDRPPFAPESDPPFIELVGQLTAECVADADGAVLRVRIEPGRFADHLRQRLGNDTSGWGLHRIDVNLVEGNLLDAIPLQAAAWRNAPR